MNDAASAVEEVQAEPVEEVEAEEVPITEEATVEPDTDAVTLTEEIPVSADESVIEEVKFRKRQPLRKKSRYLQMSQSSKKYRHRKRLHPWQI